MRDVGIVGGGMLGLTIGLRLAQRGHRVTVFEAEPAVGGLAAAGDIGSLRWDRFYHVVLGADKYLLALLDEIGLGGRIVWGKTRTGFYVDGKWHSMSSALDFLRFPPLSLLEKVRLGATLVGASRIRDWRNLEQVTAIDWLTRWSGRRTVEQIWTPLLRSKLGPHAEAASAAFIWAIIVRLYGARQSGMKHESIGYIRGGYDAVLPVLRSYVERSGVRIVTEARVTAVRPWSDGVMLQLQDGRTHEVGDAVLTVSCPRIMALCQELSPGEKERLGRVVYQGVVCPSFLLRRPIKGYYVTNITDPGIPFTGIIELTALVDPAVFGGRHLVYLPRYVSQEDQLWNSGDEAVADMFFAALQRMVPGLGRDDVIARRVARAREVLAVSTLRYSTDVMPPLRTSLPHVFVANSAQIAQGTLNVDETVALAERSAAALEAQLGPVGSERAEQHA
ncbi:MAG: NAD(P)/FAD-dependent oxidoreductase [Gemmatimonadaceae bacterium]